MLPQNQKNRKQNAQIYSAGRTIAPRYVYHVSFLLHFIEPFPRRVAGVQQLVGQVAVGLAQELLIELDDLGIET